jgi:ketosteroid isomerase-like protein
MSETNEQIVLRYVEAFNRGDIEGLCALFAADAVIHGVLGSGPLSAVRPIWQDLIDCFGIQLAGRAGQLGLPLA